MIKVEELCLLIKEIEAKTKKDIASVYFFNTGELSSILFFEPLYPED